MRSFFVVLLFTSSLFSATLKNNWTINLSQANSMKEVNSLINNIKSKKSNIYIFLKKDKYIITYGVFSNYLEASSFFDKNKRDLKFNNPYILKTRYNLKQKDIPNLVKVINYKSSERKKTLEKKQDNKEKPKEIKRDKKVVKKDYNFALSLEYSQNTLNGNIKTSGDTKIDFKDDLGLDDTQNLFIPKLLIKINPHKIYFSHYSTKLSSKKTLTKDLIIDNFTYSNTDSVNTSLNFRSTQFGYRYMFKSFDFGFDYLLFENSFDISSSSRTTNIDGEYSMYILALDKKFKIEDYSFKGSIAWGPLGDVDYLLYSLLYNHQLKEDIDISLGYEVKQMDIDSKSYSSSIDSNKFFIRLNKTF